MKSTTFLAAISFVLGVTACTNDDDKVIKAYYAALFAGDVRGMEAVMVPQQASILLPMMGMDVQNGKFKGCTLESYKKQPEKMPIGQRDTEMKITEMTLYLVSFKCAETVRTDKMLVIKQDGHVRVGLKN